MRISDWSSDVCSSDLIAKKEMVEAQIRLDHFLLGDARLALALLDHVHDAAELGQAHARGLRDLADLGADAVDRGGLIFGEGGPFLVDPADFVEPILFEFAADIMVEERLARHLVALGEAQHLAAERGQAAVVAVELVDQIFDLGAVELHAFDLRGQFFAQLRTEEHTSELQSLMRLSYAGVCLKKKK